MLPGRRYSRLLSWYAHVLLSLTRIGLVDHLVTAEGWDGHRVRAEIAALGREVLQVAAAAPGR